MQTIVLLPGVSIVELGDPSTAHGFNITGGVLHYNDSFLLSSPSFLRWHARESLGAIGNFTLWNRPTILDGPSPPCPAESSRCVSRHIQYFLQKLQYKDTSWEPRFLELQDVPMYTIVLSELGIQPNRCTLYGYRNARMRICMEADNEGNPILGTVSHGAALTIRGFSVCVPAGGVYRGSLR